MRLKPLGLIQCMRKVAKPLDLINLTVEIKTFNLFLVLSVVDNAVLNLGTKNFFKGIRKELFYDY